MRILDMLTATIGAPHALREFGGAGRSWAAVSRWHHDGARFDLRGVDSVQLILSISGGHRVELRSADHRLTREVCAGAIGVTAPGDLDSVQVIGPADLLQISISQEAIRTAVASAAAAPAGVHRAPCDARLQALAAQALVALARSGEDERLGAIVLRIAALVARPAAEPPGAARGGLSPAARRRVHALVRQRLDAAPWASPSLHELADAARLSVHHFARAYRKTEGQPPHAHLLTHRIKLALSMLLQTPARVDHVGEMSGFASSAHFVSAFRKHVGVSPGAVRDAARSKLR